MKLNRRHLSALTAALLFSVCTVAFGGEDTNADKKKAVQQAAEVWGKATHDKDKKAMSQMVADDFLHVTPDGKVLDKNATINAFLNPNLTMKLEKRDNETIRVYGSNAVVTGRQVVTISLDGKSDTIEVRDTTCWLLKDNRWQLSVYQATLVR